MKPQTLTIDLFDLPRFVDSIVELWGDQEVAFPLVENGYADFGTACLGDDADDAGDNPIEWLQHGNTLFGQFARRDDTNYTLPNQVVIDVSDVGDDDETYIDEFSTYGFLVQLKDGFLTLRTALLRDITGEPTVTVVDDSGVFEEEMKKFLGSVMLTDRASPGGRISG